MERCFVVSKSAFPRWSDAFDDAWGRAGEFGTVIGMVDYGESDIEYEFILEIDTWEASK